MKASNVSEWLRRSAGTRDHRKLVEDEDSNLVLRPGPNFDLLLSLLGNVLTTPPLSSALEREPARTDRRKARNQP